MAETVKIAKHYVAEAVKNVEPYTAWAVGIPEFYVEKEVEIAVP